RMQLRIPLFPIEGAREAVPAALDFVIYAEIADLERLYFRNVSAAHEHVAHIDLAQHLREQIIQIVTGGDAIEIRRILFGEPGEVYAVRMRVVQKVALDPPN